MATHKAKLYSPEYELSRELLNGEFENDFSHANSEADAKAKSDAVFALADIIQPMRESGKDILEIVESKDVQDYLTKMAAGYGAKKRELGGLAVSFGLLTAAVVLPVI